MLQGAELSAAGAGLSAAGAELSAAGRAGRRSSRCKCPGKGGRGRAGEWGGERLWDPEAPAEVAEAL